MVHRVYVLVNAHCDTYVGQTNDRARPMAEHNDAPVAADMGCLHESAEHERVGNQHVAQFGSRLRGRNLKHPSAITAAGISARWRHGNCGG